MAKDESQNGTRPSVHPDKRVYKASDVHKRRPAPKGKKKSEEPIVEQPAQVAEQAPSLTAEPKADTRTAPIAVPEEKPASAPESTPRSTPTPRPKPERKRKAREEAPADEPVEDSGESPSEESAEAKPKKKPRWKLRIGIGIAVTLVLALAVTAAALSWNRWLRYDDAADMQGTWYAYGTKVPVTFTEDLIVFDENTAYKYTIDPEAKTIKYSIGDIEGQGRYWYSDDRTVLIITDGDDYTKWGTVSEDFNHWVSCLFNGTSLPMNENSIAFSRVAMNEGLVKVEPKQEQQSQSSSSTAAEASTSSASSASSSSSSSSSTTSEEPASDKAALSQLPISDIIVEDNTPVWGEENE